ncbi:MAG: diguanylate cyclase, partial [Armatimonadota bacterium]|nr:diguanylate cyclase [Armatimonadota bacterium]
MQTTVISQQAISGPQAPNFRGLFRHAGPALFLVGILALAWALWRYPWISGSAATTGKSMVLVALLIGAGLGCAVASRCPQAARRWQGGWLLISSALLLRALGVALETYWGQDYAGALLQPWQTVLSGLFIFQAVLLCAGLWCLAGVPGFSSVAQWTPVVDAILLGTSVASLGWWLLLEPALRAVAPRLSGALSLHLWVATAGTVALMAALLKWTKRERILPGWLLLSLGSGFFAAVDYRYFWLLSHTPPKGQQPLFDLVLLALAPLVMGVAALWQMSAQASARATTPPAWPGPLSSIRRFVASLLYWGPFVLPCLILLMGTWHVNNATRQIDTTPSESWAVAFISIMALLRHALVFRHSARETSQSLHAMNDLTASLREEVMTRTHQLATLRAVAAELNNTLDIAHVLRTGLERMVDVIGADAGAVWLQVDLERAVNLASDGPQHPAGHAVDRDSSASFLLRAVEHSEQEQRRAEGTPPHRSPLTDQMLIEYGLSDLDAIPPEISSLASTDPTTGHPVSFGTRWRLVRSRGEESQRERAALYAMHEALEAGDLERCMDVCESLEEKFEGAYVVPIRWKGEVLGVMGVLRRQKALAIDEAALLQSMAMEVGAALKNAHLYQEASRLADRDSVTDLLNHRAIQQQLNSCLSRARRTEGEFVVVMMDLNNFKFFNDTYGHVTGDKVLRTVANSLRESCRISDLLGRFGGDEFIALLLDTDAPGAEVVCSRIAESLAAKAFEGGDGRRIPISLSFGAAVFPHDGDTALELLTVADANLYESKRAGKLMMSSHTGEMQERRELKDSGIGGSFGVLDALVTAIDNKDQYTRRHSEDVTHWAVLMARELGYSTETQRAVRICGLLHDVGKIAVPDQILRKPGRLNDEEFRIMQQHPVFGALIVKDVPNLTDVLGGIRHHHERYDGKGYP